MTSTTSLDQADPTKPRADRVGGEGLDASLRLGAWAIEVHANVEAIADDWRRLEAAGALTPFQSLAWVRPLYAELAPNLGARPLVVLVRDRPGGAPVMLLPLCARRLYGIRVIEFADLGASDYNAPILAENFTPSPNQWRDLWRRILAALAPSGAALRLNKAPLLIEGRKNPMVAFGDRSTPMGFSAWSVSLPPTRAEFCETTLDPSFAREIAKKFRRVAKHGAIEFAFAETPIEKRVAFDILTRQRQARFDEMGRVSNALAQPDYRRFYRSAAVESAASLAQLALLKVGGEIVATLFALRRRDAFHVIMSTFEGGEWKRCSLGSVLIQAAAEHCIDLGVATFDLTIGDEDYKQKFGARPSPLFAAWTPITPLGAGLVFTARIAARLKAMIRTIRGGHGRPPQ